MSLRQRLHCNSKMEAEKAARNSRRSAIIGLGVASRKSIPTWYCTWLCIIVNADLSNYTQSISIHSMYMYMYILLNAHVHVHVLLFSPGIQHYRVQCQLAGRVQTPPIHNHPRQPPHQHTSVVPNGLTPGLSLPFSPEGVCACTSQTGTTQSIR